MAIVKDGIKIYDEDYFVGATVELYTDVDVWEKCKITEDVVAVIFGSNGAPTSLPTSIEDAMTRLRYVCGTTYLAMYPVYEELLKGERNLRVSRYGE